MKGNKPIKTGITGQSGFIGTHLAETLKASPEYFEIIPFSDDFFSSQNALNAFIKECQVIIHLAAMNRPADSEAVYKTNIELTGKLISALKDTERAPGVIFSSSIREGENTCYGQAKAVCREMLEQWAQKSGGKLSTLHLPNTFGAGALPFDNSFIATFSYQIIHGLQPVVTENRIVPLIHVDSLCTHLSQEILTVYRFMQEKEAVIRARPVEPDFRMSVPEVLKTLESFWQEYLKKGKCIKPANINQEKLLETFLSYLPV